MLTGKHLRSYLAYAVHGRKPMGQANSAQPKIRKGPPRDEVYKDWIRTLDCCACGRCAPSEAAHTGSDGGMSMKASDDSCIPLCADCSTLSVGAYHRVLGSTWHMPFTRQRKDRRILSASMSAKCAGRDSRLPIRSSD